MNKQTLKALKDSVAHWTRLSSGSLKRGEDVGPTHCGLCRLFNNDDSKNPCFGCPVFDKSGEVYCDNTPFEDASNEYRVHGIRSPQFRKAAKEELKFLKGLLPKPSKKA